MDLPEKLVLTKVFILCNSNYNNEYKIIKIIENEEEAEIFLEEYPNTSAYCPRKYYKGNDGKYYNLGSKITVGDDFQPNLSYI